MVVRWGCGMRLSRAEVCQRDGWVQGQVETIESRKRGVAVVTRIALAGGPAAGVMLPVSQPHDLHLFPRPLNDF